jgi:hypothetical protein
MFVSIQNAKEAPQAAQDYAFGQVLNKKETVYGRV